MKINVLIVNAFTEEIKGGNPAGVLLDSPSFTDEQMAYVSKELEVSETAFVFPSKKADYKTRFFSPTIEVDLCGHATIATFYTMALKGEFTQNKNMVVTQETKAGIFSVNIEFTKDKKIDRVMMHQREPVLKTAKIDISDIADSLKISVDAIDDSLPRQIVSTGLFTLPVCIKSFDTLKTIRPNFEKIKKICNQLMVGSFHLFTFETIEPGSIYHARNFAPVYAVNEDSVTGTANGAVCSYLLKNNLIKDKKLMCEQGDIIGRPGRVFVEIENNIVKVGGRARIVEEKELEI